MTSDEGPNDVTDSMESDRSSQRSHHSRVSRLTGDVRKFARYHGKACKY